MEGFCLVSFPSFSTSARTSWVQFRRGRGASLAPDSHHAESLELPAPPQRHEDLRAALVCQDGYSSESPSSHQHAGDWRLTLGSQEHTLQVPFLCSPPPQRASDLWWGQMQSPLHSSHQWPAQSRGSNTLRKPPYHAQFRHNQLQLPFTWILVVLKYFWYGWDSLLISTKETNDISKHFYSDEIDFTVVNSCLPN